MPNEISRGNHAPRQARAGKSTKVKNRALLIMYGIVLLGVITGAVLLCIFVFFRINNVVINGTTIYSTADIAAELNLKEGDNLVFANTSSCEEKLQKKFPYVEKAEIVKKIPSTVEVNITEAQVYYSFAYGDKYVYVSRGQKMLEIQDEPMTGSMVVKGMEIKENDGKIEFADISKAAIFQDISDVFAERDNIGITEINLENIHDIYVVYDSRVKMVLGSAADIDYKLTFGLRMAADGRIGPDERGRLDLSHAKDINTAYFMEDIPSSKPEEENEDESGAEPGAESGDESESGESTEASQAESEGNSENSEESGEGSGSESEVSEEEPESGSPARGDDIPDI